VLLALSVSVTVMTVTPLLSVVLPDQLVVPEIEMLPDVAPLMLAVTLLTETSSAAVPAMLIPLLEVL